MKFLEISNIIKTNALLSRYNSFYKGKVLEIEAYSCKRTRKEKKSNPGPKPLAYLIGALESSFTDYEFRELNLNSFDKQSEKNVIDFINYKIFLACKCKNELSDHLLYLSLLFKQTIDIKQSEIYKYTLGDERDKSMARSTQDEEESTTTIFLIYNKKMKRVLMVKA